MLINVKEYLKKIYQRELFFPGVLGVFVNQFYFARSGIASALKCYANELNGRLLDVGCGIKPYKDIFSVTTYIGLDLHSDSVIKRNIADYTYDGEIFPFESESFDSVLCNEVVEHVFNIENFLSEVYRVLNSNGKLLITVPFVWDEHEQPYDFARYSSFGIRHLLEKHGFHITKQIKIGSASDVILQLIAFQIYKKSTKSTMILKLLSFILIALINFTGLIIGLFPESKNKDLYMTNLILATKR